MGENSAFKRALSNFTYDVACKRAIRHLCDCGYDAGQIHEALSYPVSIGVIESEIEEYRRERESQTAGEPVYEFVTESDRFGRLSYRRVLKE